MTTEPTLTAPACTSREESLKAEYLQVKKHADSLYEEHHLLIVKANELLPLLNKARDAEGNARNAWVAQVMP